MWQQCKVKWQGQPLTGACKGGPKMLRIEGWVAERLGKVKRKLSTGGAPPSERPPEHERPTFLEPQ